MNLIRVKKSFTLIELINIKDEKLEFESIKSDRNSINITTYYRTLSLENRLYLHKGTKCATVLKYGLI